MKARHATREERARQVRDWLKSGESAARFARRLRIQPSTLSWWRWKLASEGEPLRAAPEAPVFVEVTPPKKEAEDDRVELRIADVSVFVPAGFDANTLGAVLSALRRSE